jgi:hypothetical protein
MTNPMATASSSAQLVAEYIAVPLSTASAAFLIALIWDLMPGIYRAAAVLTIAAWFVHSVVRVWRMARQEARGRRDPSARCPECGAPTFGYVDLCASGHRVGVVATRQS